MSNRDRVNFEIDIDVEPLRQTLATIGVPPISDYDHWGEDAERVWYDENRSDMYYGEEADLDEYYEDDAPEEPDPEEEWE